MKEWSNNGIRKWTIEQIINCLYWWNDGKMWFQWMLVSGMQIYQRDNQWGLLVRDEELNCCAIQILNEWWINWSKPTNSKLRELFDK